MPLYEYQCERCGHRFEAIQKFSDPPIDTCPKCQGAVHKLQSAPAFQFKGTGWYVTDYARKEQPGTPKADEAKPKDTAGEKKEGAGEKKEEGAGGSKDGAGDRKDAAAKTEQAPAKGTSTTQPATGGTSSRKD